MRCVARVNCLVINNARLISLLTFMAYFVLSQLVKNPLMNSRVQIRIPIRMILEEDRPGHLNSTSCVKKSSQSDR